MTSKEVQKELNVLENPADALFLQRFFKTGVGQYGEGDIFIGIRVPVIRKIAKKFASLPLKETIDLLQSPVHEHRLCALIIMVEQAKRGNGAVRWQLYEAYLGNTAYINNWDLVDASCRDIVGGYLLDKPRDTLYELARSSNVWERRIAIVSTWQFIRVGQLDDTFKIAEILLGDQHDLIHKAVGWMLREAGKKSESELLAFLDTHAHEMPRTALRYSLERLPNQLRAVYMTKVGRGVQ